MPSLSSGHTTRGRQQSHGLSARDAVAVVASLTTYALTVLPRVRREIDVWRQAARSMPDGALRDHALCALSEKALNAEATAVFAILTPRARRAEAIRLMTAYQVMTDYLDSVSELPNADPLGNGLQLHRALSDALLPGLAGTDYYLHHAGADDGGYLDRLVSACHRRFRALPSAPIVRACAVRAAERCGAGQSHTHAAMHDASGRFAAWAERLAPGGAYEWWELAAGASSSVAVHALLAAAADARTTPMEAELLDAAYFPPIGALTVLFDDLVDRERDALTGSHNYFAYYRSSTVAAERIAGIFHEADTAIARLPHRREHAAILAGVAGFYLSAAEAGTTYAQPIRERVLATAGPRVTPILALTGLRRRLGGH